MHITELQYVTDRLPQYHCLVVMVADLKLRKRHCFLDLEPTGKQFETPLRQS